MSTFILILSGIFISLQVQAKVWRVNNILGVNANFTNLPAALSSASVVNGDTLYIEGSPTIYGGFTLNKKLVIIGTGYFLSGTNSNPGLQANPYSSSFGGQAIVFDSTASGSVLMGLDNFFMGVGSVLGSATDSITITRCNFGGIGIYYGATANTTMKGWKVNKSYITGTIGDFLIQDWEVRNNIIIGGITLTSLSNSNNIFRNNVFRSGITIYNGYFANNIISNNSCTFLNVTLKNNLCVGAPAGFSTYAGTNGNINNQSDAALFEALANNSTDGFWRLKPGSPAIGAGLTIGAVVSPDCGAYGGPDPYIISGIPNIPTIYTLTVPASIPAGTATMNITVSTKNNN